jgi:diaminobutyrate-2-oxoglutarate transaminase
VILRFVRLDDFDTDHQTETANVADYHVRGLGLMIGIEIVKPNEAQDHMGCYPADGELSAHDFDTDHQTETANVADYRVAFLQLRQFAFQPLALSALLQKKCFEAGLILERGGRHGCVLRLLPSLLTG